MKNEKSIFETNSLFRLSLKVVVPSLLVMLLFGIYIFIDQILMQQIIPNNGVNFFYNDFLINNFSNDELENIFLKIYPIENNNFLYDGSNINFDKAIYQSNKDVIFLSITTIGTINLIFISIGLFINTGASILYSRSLARKNYLNCESIWNSSFYSCLFFSIFVLVLILASQNAILKTIVPSSESFSANYNDSNINSYYSLYTEAVIRYSNNYTFFITLSIPMLIMVNLFMFFIRTEGKNLWITIFAFASCSMNVAFDFINFEFCKLNIVGGGIATFLSYFFNLVVLVIYILIMNRKKLFNFNFKNLNKIRINFSIFYVSFFLSLGTFLRDLSMAIANIIYVPVFTHTMKTIILNGGMDSTELNDMFSISVTPIYNLFFFSLFGIIDGLRPIISYNYELKKINLVKKTYYSGMVVSLIFAFLSIFLVFTNLNNGVLTFFNANTPQRQEIYKLMLSTMMFQLPFVALSISGMSIFQSNGKIIMTSLLSTLQGLICFVPIIFMMAGISVWTNNKNYMIYAGFVNMAFSSLVIELFSEIYLHFYIGKKEKYENTTERVDFLIKKLSKNLFNKNENAI